MKGWIGLLREQDGVHFTTAGYRKLAHFVERELKRDIAQARQDRAVPGGDAAPAGGGGAGAVGGAGGGDRLQAGEGRGAVSQGCL